MSFGFGFSLPAYEGYAAGFGPSSFGSGASLALDFLNGNNTLSPLITFSRTTNATLTGSNGLIQYAPMNLLTFSEQFDNAAWSKAATTVTANAAVAPNGTTTADKLVESAATSNHYLYPTSFTAGTYMVSIWCKAAERSFVQIAGTISVNDFVTFNLSSGSISQQGSGASNAVIVASGDGWYRCSVTLTLNSSGPCFVVCSTGTGGWLPSYAGSTSNGIFIWGAQLELGSTATTYNPTTVKNLLGFTENFDNAAWTKSNAFVQTNLLTFSEQFDNASWAKGNGSITSNTTTSPDGTATADSFITAATTAGTFVQQAFTSLAQAYAASFYVKPNGVQFIQLLWAGTQSTNIANFDIVNGVVGTSTATSSSITPAGNGWYRVVIVSTLAAAAGAINVYCVPTLTSARAANFTGDGTNGIYVWGAQLVLGATPGDYKATYAAAAAVGYTDIYGQPFAQKLVENTVTGLHAVSASGVAVGSNATVTVSVYAKAAERTWLRLDNFYTNSAFFDLANGVVGTVSSGTAAIVPVGNGWYRCSLVGTASGTLSGFAASTATGNGTVTYTGDGTSGIYIFGAQLSDSASVDPYVYQPAAAPTSTAYYGPRFDYDASTATYTELLGPELVTNGNFSNGTTGWFLESGWSVANGTASYLNDSTTGFNNIYQIKDVVAGRVYKFSLSVTNRSAAGRVAVRFGPSTYSPDITTNGEFVCYLAASATGNLIVGVQHISGGSAGTVTITIDNVSVKEYLGTTATGAVPKGLLIEEQRTNLLTYSEQFDNAAWSKTNATVTANAAISPDGTVDADKLAEDSATGFHHITQTGVASSSTFAIYAKAAERRRIVLREGTVGYQCTFDLVSGTVVNGTGSIAPVGNGWYRCTTPFATAGNVQVFTARDTDTGIASYAGTAGFGIFIYGAQLEAGAFATSYIPTVASQVTRAADNASMVGNNFARWYNVTSGTLSVDTGSFPVALATAAAFNPVAVGSFLALRAASSGPTVVEMTWVANSIVAGALGASNKIAGGYSGVNVSLCANSSTVTTSASSDFSGTATSLVIGAQTGTTRIMNSTIARIAYYPRRLANTELTSLTS